MSKETKIEFWAKQLQACLDAAAADLGTGTATAQAKEDALSQVENMVHRKMFGHAHDEKGEEVP